MRTLRIALIVIISIIGFPERTDAQAQPTESRSERQLQLDGRTYPETQILAAFLDAAFTNDVVNENSSGRLFLREVEREPESPYAPDNLKRSYPWLYPLVYQENGLPRLLAVTKWTQPVLISFGFPNDLKPFSNEERALFQLLPQSDGSFERTDSFRALESGILHLIKELADIPNLDVRYLPHNKETLENFGNVRIVLVDRKHYADSPYRERMNFTSLSGSGLAPLHFRALEQSEFRSGVTFAAQTRKQVDGYLLADEGNEIEMAFCYIWSGHDAPMLKALTIECVIRSLGLPGEIYVAGYPEAPKSALTAWNEPARWPEKHRAAATLPSGLSEFDRHMIKSLYRSDLRAGVDYIQAQEFLRSVEETTK